MPRALPGLLRAAERAGVRRRPDRPRLRPQRPARRQPDRRRNRLWLIDWDYAGFNSPLFDLGSLAVQQRADAGESQEVAARSLFRPPARRRTVAALRAMNRRLAAARGHVEHGVGGPLRDRLRLRRLHRRQPARLRGPPGPTSRHGARHDRPPHHRQGRRRRRRHHRLLDRLPSRAARLDRRRADRAAQLTSGSTFHAAGLVGQLRSSANITQLLGYSVELYHRLEAETGPGHRLEDERRPSPRLQRRALDRGAGGRRRPRTPSASTCICCRRRRRRTCGR